MLIKFQNFIEKNLLFILFVEISIFCIFSYLVMNDISPVNKYDENAYLNHVRTILMSDNYWYLGDRNRMPFFNYYLSLFYNTELSELDNYYNLKYANLILSCILAFLFFLKIEKKFSNKIIFFNLSFLVLVIPTFALIHQLLVETIFFLGFCLLLIYFEQFYSAPTQKNAIILGAIGAAVYFLKYTGLTVFFALSLFSVIYGYLYKKYLIKRFLIVFLTFFTLVSPYLYENYQNFNKHIFYNVNSEFYIWADSWDEIVNGVRANNDRIGWPTMDESELPSFSKYVSEHTISETFERFAFGFKSIGIDYFNLEKLGSHISYVSLSILLMILYITKKNKLFHELKPTYYDIITILTTGFILLSSAFYSYISTGLRYTLPIAIPLLLMVFLKLDLIIKKTNGNDFSKIFFLLIFVNIFVLFNSYINLLP
tara:strand:- start:594 stop:1871 length:1278 start_codon:yes stop_codon:yes gene_type:complete